MPITPNNRTIPQERLNELLGLYFYLRERIVRGKNTSTFRNSPDLTMWKLKLEAGHLFLKLLEGKTIFEK